jgi:predicted CopG family antitoxin
MREITVTDDQYEQLEKASAQTGKSISELVEAAIDKEYGTAHRERLRQAFRESAGAAGPEDFDGLSGEEYVAKIRRGWGERAGVLGGSSR